MHRRLPQSTQSSLEALQRWIQSRSRAIRDVEVKRLASQAHNIALRVIRKRPSLDTETLSKIPIVTPIVVVVGILVSISGYFSINYYATSRIQHDLDRAAAGISHQLTDAINRQLAVAESTRALLAGPKRTVNRWSFFEFARALPRRDSDLGSIEWIPRVATGQRAAFEKRAKMDGLFDFHFVERGDGGSLVKASDRNEYYPVYYIEPYQGNEAELGVDLAADSAVADVLGRARDSAATVATSGRLMATRNTSVQGFFVVVPVYRSILAPLTIAERRKSLAGFVRVAFRFDKVLDSLVSGLGQVAPFQFYIFGHAEGKPPSLVYFASSQSGTSQAAVPDEKTAYEGSFATIEHRVGDWHWSLVVKPVDSAFQGILAVTSWGFAAFALLLTALLAQYLTRMKSAREKAEAANQAKSSFLAMMCHELRTPLNSVIGFSEIMINEMFGPLNNDKYEDYMANINRSANHLLALINTILSFSKGEARSLLLKREDFDLATLWEPLVIDLQSSIDHGGVELEENISASSFRLHADPIAFRQILQNLVLNAIKFTPHGGRVTVTAAHDSNGGLALTIADTGIGISEENLELVFQPFRQVDNSLSRKYEGVGLGLPLTRMLVEQHGGALSITSQLNEGTSILLEFPAEIFSGDGDFPANDDIPSTGPDSIESIIFSDEPAPTGERKKLRTRA